MELTLKLIKIWLSHWRRQATEDAEFWIIEKSWLLTTNSKFSTICHRVALVWHLNKYDNGAVSEPDSWYDRLGISTTMSQQLLYHYWYASCVLTDEIDRASQHLFIQNYLSTLKLNNCSYSWNNHLLNDNLPKLEWLPNWQGNYVVKTEELWPCPSYICMLMGPQSHNISIYN